MSRCGVDICGDMTLKLGEKIHMTILRLLPEAQKPEVEG